MSALMDGDILGPWLRGIGVGRWSGEDIYPFWSPGNYTIAAGVVRVEDYRDLFGIEPQWLHHPGSVGLEQGCILSCE